MADPKKPVRRTQLGTAPPPPPVMPPAVDAWLNQPQPVPSHVSPKPATIGASRVGERYIPPTFGQIMGSDNPLQGVAEHVIGPSRPPSVAAADPYGIGAWEKGAGPPPMLLGTTEPVGPGIRAYHGSPHSFDAFDLSKIGTGEGAQAYGRGMYFGENEATAKYYRDKLSGQLPEGWAKQYPATARSYIQGMVGDVAAGKVTPEQAAKHIYNANSVMRKYDPSRLATELADAARSTKGHMYEVDIGADPSHLLDWDRPVPEQSPQVQERLADVVKHPAVRRKEAPWLGQDAYYRAEEMYGGPKATADAFRISGIPGVKFRDQLSRQDVMTDIPYLQQQIFDAEEFLQQAKPHLKDQGQTTLAFYQQLLDEARKAPKPTHNIVVWDPKVRIDILRKYGLLPPVAAGALGLAGSANDGAPPVMAPR